MIIPDIKNKEITVKRKYNSWYEDGNARTYRKTRCLRKQSVRGFVLYQKIDRKSRHSF